MMTSSIVRKECRESAIHLYADSANVSSKEIPWSSECVIARLLSGGERGDAERSLGYEERWLKRDGEVAHGGAGKVRRLHEREGNPTVNVRDGPLHFERFGLDSRLVHHRTAPVCSGSAPYPVHRHRKEVEIDFEHGFVLAQTAPSYFVSVPSPSRQSPRVQRTFLSEQELRIARVCFGFAQFFAHLYRPLQKQDPERSCRFRSTH